jgi:5-methylcytosine-specific restriction endonuclease McrA
MRACGPVQRPSQRFEGEEGSRGVEVVANASRRRPERAKFRVYQGGMDTSPLVPPGFDSLSDDALHAVVRRLTARSNVALADLLAHLGEVEARGIHRNRACATLYTYCVYDLRMSEDAAYRRSKAARFVRQHPELRGMLARGELHLTGLLMIAPYLGAERHSEILERVRFRSKREIAGLIAELDPKPEVPPRIEPIAPAAPPRARTLEQALAGPVRNLREGDRPEDWLEPDAGDLTAPSLAEAERALEGAWQARREATPGRPLRYKVQFTASQEYVDLLDEALDLLGFQKQATRLPDLQLRVLRDFVERLRKRKTGTRQVRAATKTPVAPAPVPEGETSAAAAPKRDASAAPKRDADVSAAPARVPSMPARAPGRHRSSHGRYVPVAVRRAIWGRDASQCAYVDERGQRCSERRGLEVHHRQPHALGGPPTIENLQLRCRAHNTLAAEQDFGRETMNRMSGKESTEPRGTALEGGRSRAATWPTLRRRRDQR